MNRKTQTTIVCLSVYLLSLSSALASAVTTHSYNELSAYVPQGKKLTDLTPQEIQDTVVWRMSEAIIPTMEQKSLGQGLSGSDQKLLKKYLTLGESETKEITGINKSEQKSGALNQLADLVDDETDTVKVLRDAFNFGKEVWSFVEENRSVVDFGSEFSANALPSGVEEGNELMGWSEPQSRTYARSYKNLYGLEVVRLEYQVIYKYGGTRGNGDRYLRSIRVRPTYISTYWGFNLDASVKVADVLTRNYENGQKVAAMELEVNWTVESLLSRRQHSATYDIRGDGKFQVLK